MQLRHLSGKIQYELDPRVFHLLCENFCLLESDIYASATKNGYLTLKQLADLARSARLPYALFFATYDRIEKLISVQNDELFGALDERYIMGSRGTLVDIRWIRRIILDLSRKQKLFGRYRQSDRLDAIIGRLKNSKRPPREQADYILKTSGIDIEAFRGRGSKSAALKYLRDQLATKNIHVSIEAQNCMPQSIPLNLKSSLSGFYVRDWKNPYLFICNELSGNPDMGSGRKVYTLLFLLVCIYKDKSYAISIDKNTYAVDKKKYRELGIAHAIVNELLMPLEEISGEVVYDYADLYRLSMRYKITPKAVLQRLYDTKIIKSYKLYKYLSDECRAQFLISVKKNGERGGGSPSTDTMIQYYQGDFLNFLRTEVPAVERSQLTKKHVSFNRMFYRLEQE